MDDESVRQECSQKTNLFMKSQQQDAVYVDTLRDASAAWQQNLRKRYIMARVANIEA